MFIIALDDFITYIPLLNSSEDQRPTFPVPAAQINSRTSQEDLEYFCLVRPKSPHDRSVSMPVRNIPGVTSLLSCESLHTFHISFHESSMGQSYTMLSLDIVVNVWLLHYDVHNVGVATL